MKETPVSELSPLKSNEEKSKQLEPKTLRGSELLVILSDEGGLPVFTRFVQVNDFGDITYKDTPSTRASNENIVLISGLLEAIIQLKDIIKPTLTDLTGKSNLPIYVDYAKAESGISLLSMATTAEFQQLPGHLLSQYIPFQTDTNLSGADSWERNFEEAMESPLGEDAVIYKNILGKIKVDLADFISFILVYDYEGNYLFSTAKQQELQGVADPLLNSISQYIKREYLMHKYRENLSLIGAKRLHDSVIWHFKCFDKIFVFFTYVIPDLYDFEILKTEMITFITNNLEKFIKATKLYSSPPGSVSSNIKTTRFTFLS
ncbi:MAG: hypothetical protein ACW98F_02995 [Candidatus Hodarchaeales archaeon]